MQSSSICPPKEERKPEADLARKANALPARRRWLRIFTTGLAADRVFSARQNSKAIGLYPSGDMVLGFPSANTAGNKQRPSRQRTRRFSFYYRFDDDRNRSFGMLQRSMGHRGHVQKHKTVSGWTAASDIQRPGPRTSGGVESVSVFDGMAVVSQTKIQSENILGSAVVQA